jgi:hypothetical protein
MLVSLSFQIRHDIPMIDEAIRMLLRAGNKAVGGVDDHLRRCCTASRERVQVAATDYLFNPRQVEPNS